VWVEVKKWDPRTPTALQGRARRLRKIDKLKRLLEKDKSPLPQQIDQHASQPPQYEADVPRSMLDYQPSPRAYALVLRDEEGESPPPTQNYQHASQPLQQVDDESPLLLEHHPSLRASPAPSAKRQKGPVRPKNWITPLTTVQQTLLYCGNNQDLYDYLKGYDLHWRTGPAVWSAIRKWTYSPTGRNYLKNAGFDRPECLTLDHIHSKNGGRIEHPFNCFLLPGAPNSHFRDAPPETKAWYIGMLAAGTADRFCKWFTDQANRTNQIDCTKFMAYGV
jgi:hypothetical protein